MFSKEQLKSKYFAKKISMLGLSLFIFQNASYGMDSGTGKSTPPAAADKSVDTLTSKLKTLSFQGYTIPTQLLGFEDAPEGLPSSIKDFFAKEAISQAEYAVGCIGNEQLNKDFYMVPFQPGKGSIVRPDQDLEIDIDEAMKMLASLSEVDAYQNAYAKEETPVSFTEKARLRREQRTAQKAAAQNMDTDEKTISPVSVPSGLSSSSSKDLQNKGQRKHKGKPKKILTDNEVYHAPAVIEKKSLTRLPEKRDDEALGNL